MQQLLSDGRNKAAYPVIQRSEKSGSNLINGLGCRFLVNIYRGTGIDLFNIGSKKGRKFNQKRGRIINEETEKNTISTKKPVAPILQLYRLNYVKIGGKILDSTNAKLEKYIRYATERMKTEITSSDVIEHGLKLLFDRDNGFKDWLKRN